MTIRFRMSTAAGALLAATVMGAAGMAAAQAQSAPADAVVIAPGPDEAANTDNGVRAAPSGAGRRRAAASIAGPEPGPP